MKIEVIRPVTPVPQPVVYERRKLTRVSPKPRHRSIGRTADTFGEMSNRLPDGKNTEIIREVLKTHNYYRARHGVPPLEISDRVNRMAQAHAEKLAAVGGLHVGIPILDGVPVGENLTMLAIPYGPLRIDTKEAAKDAVKRWYSGKVFYNPKKLNFGPDSGAFTQVVWKDTRRLGVGIATSADQRRLWIVANYYPAGNIMFPGAYEKNVLPAKF